MMKWEENCHDPYTSSVSKKHIQTNFVLSVKATTKNTWQKCLILGLFKIGKWGCVLSTGSGNSDSITGYLLPLDTFCKSDLCFLPYLILENHRDKYKGGSSIWKYNPISSTFELNNNLFPA